MFALFLLYVTWYMTELTEPIHILFQQPTPNYCSTNANANALFCHLMLMPMHYIYKEANANANSNDAIMV